MTALLLLLFFVALAVGVPIAIALGAASAAVVITNDLPFQIVAQRMHAALDVYALTAIPFFILAGELMAGSGVLERLLAFARLIVGRFRGGLAQVNIFASMLFGGINGSAIADASAIGSVMIPPTVKEYKDPGFACAVTACSSVIGPIIPPSIPVIVYALVAENVSVETMFIMGIVPGILLALGMMAIVAVRSHIYSYPAIDSSYSPAEVFRITRRFLVAFMLPVIMVGGILTGVFTATEAGSVAVVYTLVVGFFVTRELTLRELRDATIRTAVTTSVVFLMISVAGITGWIFAIDQVSAKLGGALLGVASNPVTFLVLVAVIMLIAGLVLEMMTAMILFVPVIIPLAASLGVDPARMGIVIVISLAIGLVTPPVGMCLFVVSKIGRVTIESVFMSSIYFLMWMIACLMLVIALPDTLLNPFGFL